jgi:hypothetical protein
MDILLQMHFNGEEGDEMAFERFLVSREKRLEGHPPQQLFVPGVEYFRASIN